MIFNVFLKKTLKNFDILNFLRTFANVCRRYSEISKKAWYILIL